MSDGKVDEWLQRVGLSQYAEAFGANDIEFDLLPELTDADLRELGIASLGHRKRLLSGIGRLRPASPAEPSEPLARPVRSEPPAPAAHSEPPAPAAHSAPLAATEPSEPFALAEPLAPAEPAEPFTLAEPSPPLAPAEPSEPLARAEPSPPLPAGEPSEPIAPALRSEPPPPPEPHAATARFEPFVVVSAEPLAPASPPEPPAPPVRPEPPAVSVAERRQATILFADLCDFATLSGSLDPEEIRELAARFAALVDGVVVSQGGTIDKPIGDAVMAFFGAPVAHDDDPYRAARAALDIHAELARASAGAPRELRAHIGVASGEVIAGGPDRVGTPDYTVLDESVNLPARLVALAGPGETLLSEGVFRAVADRCICDPLGDAQVDGLDAPGPIWRLTGLPAEPSAVARSPFVGRAAEIAQFKGLLAATLAKRGGRVVYLRGEAGIGKTRLVEEMRSLAEASGFVAHRGLVLDFGVGNEQGAMRMLLFSLLGLPLGASPEDRRAKVEDLLASKAVAPQQAPFLNDALDLEQEGEWRALYEATDTAARLRGRRALMAAVTARACAKTPTLFIVEDLHWADAHLLGHLAALASALADGEGLMVLTSRVEGDPINAAWRASCRGTSFATLDLGPLRSEEALTLAGGFIDPTEQVARACIERAAGNPLFLEQLLRHAQEGGADAIPPSLRSLVLARMDRLATLDRQAFQAAAVIGQRFDLPLLRHLMGDPGYVCHRLVGHALVLPEGDDYLFAHALIQEGAYASLLWSTRKALHLEAAQWFEGKDPLLRAQHFDRADDERAPGAYLAAAIAQRAAFRVEAALQSAARGLEIARGDADRHELLCLSGDLQRDLGDIAASIACYRAAVAAASDDHMRCHAELGLAESLRFGEGLEEALQLLASAQQTAEREQLVADLARVHHLRGNIYFPIGNIEGCQTEHELGLRYATLSGSAEAEARALGGLADAAYAQGKMRTAFAHFSRCVALCEQHGFGRIEVANRSMVGFSRAYLNEPRQARDDGDAAARVAAMVGQPRAELLGETMGMLSSYELGDHDALKSYLQRVLRLVRQLGAKRFEAQALELEARMLLDCGRRREAEGGLREALALCREAGAQFCGPKVAGALARAVEDPAESAKLLDEGKAMLDRGAVGHNHLWFYRDAIEAKLNVGDAEGALHYVKALEHYTRAEPLPWSGLFVERGRVLADALRRIDDGVVARLRETAEALKRAELRSFLRPIEAAVAG